MEFDEINWLIPFEGPEGIPLLTYGAYGGLNWSGGAFVPPNQPGDYTVTPTDPLDTLFRFHDQAYDETDTLVRAQADVALIEGIQDLPEDAVSGEGDLYGGAAILLHLYQIAFVNKHPELLLQLDFRNTVEDAVGLIEQGGLEPDREERAGVIAWLTTLGDALAASDNPIAQDIAADFADFVAALNAAPADQFQDVLNEETQDFLEDFASHLEDAVEAIADPVLPDRPEPPFDVHDVAGWLEETFPGIPDAPQVQLEALADRLKLPWQGDFLI